MRSPGEMYAIIRTAKLKSSVGGDEMSSRHGTPPQCIDDAADHELRLKDIANADPSKLRSNRLMVLTGDRFEDLDFEEARRRGLLRHGLFRTLVNDRLALAGIPAGAARRNQVLAQQVMVTASHEFFSRAPAVCSDVTDEPPISAALIDDRYRRWRKDSVAFLRDKYGDRIVAIVEHLDELTPHLTAVVVPLVRKSVKLPGRGSKEKPAVSPAWRLCAFDLFNKKTLAALWTEYADAMKEHGLHRPPRHAMIASSDVKQFYAAVADATQTAAKLQRTLSFSLPPLESRVFAESAKSYRDRATLLVEQWKRDVAQLLRTLQFQAKAVELLRNRETELRRARREADERSDADKMKMALLAQEKDALRSLTTDIAPGRVLEKLGLELEVEGQNILRADLADGRVVRTTTKGFTVSGPSVSDKPVGGKGAVELFAALFKVGVAEAITKCVICFGGDAMGPIHVWSERHFIVGSDPEAARALRALIKPVPIVTPPTSPHPGLSWNASEQQKLHRDTPPER